MNDGSHRLLKTLLLLGVLGAIAYALLRRGLQSTTTVAPVERPEPRPGPAMEAAPAQPAPAKKKAPPKKAPAKKKAPPKKAPAKKAPPPPPPPPPSAEEE